MHEDHGGPGLVPALPGEVERLWLKIEAYPFESEGGPLTMCRDWSALRTAILAALAAAYTKGADENAKWECPKCGLTMWAGHTNADGSLTCPTCDDLPAALAQRDAETVPLIRLGLAALEACRDGCDYDGWDIQDNALTFGVVSKVEVGEGRYCSEGCRCEEYDADICYRDTPETVRLRALAARATEG